MTKAPARNYILSIGRLWKVQGEKGGFPVMLRRRYMLRPVAHCKEGC